MLPRQLNPEGFSPKDLHERSLNSLRFFANAQNDDDVEKPPLRRILAKIGCHSEGVRRTTEESQGIKAYGDEILRFVALAQNDDDVEMLPLQQ